MGSDGGRWSAQQIAKLALGLVISAGFLWLLAHGVDIEKLRRVFTSLSLTSIAIAVLCVATGYFFRVVRWWWMLQTLDDELPLSACVWPLLSSLAVNNVLPFRAGDALRVFGFRRQLRSPAVRVLGTVIVERVFDLATLRTIFVIGLQGLAPGAFPAHFVVLASWLAGLTVAALLVLIFLTPWLEALTHRFARQDFFVRRDLDGLIREHGEHFAAALGVVRSIPRLLALAGLSSLVWLFEGLVYVTVAAAIDAVAGAPGAWFSLASGALATLIPSAPGYLGTFDYFAALGLQAYGATVETSVAFALIVHTVLWLPATVVGLAYLAFSGGRSWRGAARRGYE